MLAFLMIRKAFFLTITVLLSLLCNTAISLASDVVVVMSSDIKPYHEALEGVKETCKCRIKDVIFLNEGIDIGRKISETKPEALLAVGLDALEKLKSVNNIPVVYVMVPHSRSLMSLPNNISGTCMFISPESQIDAMLDVFPRVKRIGVIRSSRDYEDVLLEAEKIAQSMGIKLVVKNSQSQGSVFSAIDSMKGEIDLFWMLADSTAVNRETFEYMLRFSFQNRIPIFSFAQKYVEMGAVAALTVNPHSVGRQTGEILKNFFRDGYGDHAEMVYPAELSLIINRKIANKMGIRIDRKIIEKADNVIE